MTAEQKIQKQLKNAHVTYNYCGVCGYTPRNSTDEPNYAPLRWWDVDDGWKIGSLCYTCASLWLLAKPQEGDFAFHEQDKYKLENINTDEDIIDAF